MIAPIAVVSQIDLDEANDALVRWRHKMGPCNRPNGAIWAHGLYGHRQLLAVTITATLIRETSAGLQRSEALELARLCASAPDVCRCMLRLWRLLVFPPLCQRGGWSWALSYQDEAIHTGDTYRFDGWVKIGRSRSGTDARSGGRRGRNKTIWAWHPDAATRAAARMAP